VLILTDPMPEKEITESVGWGKQGSTYRAQIFLDDHPPLGVRAVRA
jgi:hypothetical protein